jgi:serine/threonine protein kinase
MQVRSGLWGNRKVALKNIQRHLLDNSEADSEWDYGRAMNDLNFELQIMSKKSLSDHRNITKLLAISFDAAEEADVPPNGLVMPILIVELADDRYPDLSLFLNSQHNPALPKMLPMETAAALIADIADGVVALHNHDIVHADLKPANILIFPDREAPCGLVAKIADFGFSGMATYNNKGQRAWLPDSRPRGGTTEWNAPECIKEPIAGYFRLEKEMPHDMPSRDIYSFGLLSSYIALDGQTPSSYIKNLQEVKLSDGMVKAVKIRLKEYHSHTLGDDWDRSLGNLVAQIIDVTLSLDHDKRERHLGGVRRLLLGR